MKQIENLLTALKDVIATTQKQDNGRNRTPERYLEECRLTAQAALDRYYHERVTGDAMPVCATCGGEGGEGLEDGWMPCYHCGERGVCDCEECSG